MAKCMSAPVLALLLPLVLGGCIFQRGIINVHDLEDRVAGVVPGQTTLGELEEMIGGPATSITPLGDSRLYVWTYGGSRTAGLSLIVVNIGKTNTGIDTALFLVDANDVVQSAQVGQNSKDLPWQWWAFGD